MKRREFLEKSGCCVTGLAASPLAVDPIAQNTTEEAAKPAKYKIEIEIYEARQDTWCHKKGEKFEYPKDMAKICPWLRGSLHDFVLLLGQGVTLPWKYEGTPYEKVIDPNGVTTEYVRCPDPTSNLVARITRTKVA